MATKITMPKLSDTMEQGIILRWLKQEGDRVEPGDVLAEVETDKANMELEVFEEGVVRKLLAAEGDGVPIGAVVGILADSEDEDISALLAEAKAEREVGAGPPAPAALDAAPRPNGGDAPVELASVPAPVTPGPAPSGRLLASPVARKLAEERGLDLATIRGSGPSGRIVKRDVLSAQTPTAPAPGGTDFGGDAGPAYTEIPMTSMMQIIARRLVESKFTAPHFYVTMDIDMDRVWELREELKARDKKVSFNDLVLKAVAHALVEVPALNTRFEGGKLLRYRDAHVGFAVAFEGGLITPVVRHANRKSLGQLAAETRELIGRAKEKKLKPDEYTGGTFTISNMGMYGIEDFTAIVNTPEVGILAVGGIRREPVVKGDAVVPGRRMKVTLSTDHRAANGADAAAFVGAIRDVLESPSLLLW